MQKILPIAIALLAGGCSDMTVHRVETTERGSVEARTLRSEVERNGNTVTVLVIARPGLYMIDESLTITANRIERLRATARERVTGECGANFAVVSETLMPTGAYDNTRIIGRYTCG